MPNGYKLPLELPQVLIIDQSEPFSPLSPYIVKYPARNLVFHLGLSNHKNRFTFFFTVGVVAPLAAEAVQGAAAYKRRTLFSDGWQKKSAQTPYKEQTAISTANKDLFVHELICPFLPHSRIACRSLLHSKSDLSFPRIHHNFCHIRIQRPK